MRPRVLRHSSDSILKRPDDTHSASVCSAARALHWHIIRQKRLVPAYRKKVTLARTQQKLTLHLALRLVLAVRPPLWHASLLSALPCASPLPQASWSGICWQRQACLYVCCTLMIPVHVPRPACQSRCDGAGGLIPTTQRAAMASTFHPPPIPSQRRAGHMSSHVRLFSVIIDSTA